ncbi:MAG: Na+/H+ antiporter subunit E [Comamonas sp.]
MIKRIFPAPLLSLFICALWLLVNRSLSSGHVALAIVFALFIPLLTRGLRPLPVRIRHPLVIARLAARIVRDTTESNLAVLRLLLSPSARLHPGRFVHVPLQLRDPNGLAVLAMIVCITPGTAWAEIARDRSMLLLHVLQDDDPQSVIDHIKAHYERPLMEIFE